MSESSASSYSQKVAKQSGSSFYLSFFSLPPAQRQAMTAVYAFCREVDDAVDEPRDIPPEQAVVEWRAEIARTFEGQPTLPLTQELSKAINQFQLTRAYFDGILDGVTMDLKAKRYPTFDALSEYCYHVAGEVGLLCMEIFGYRSERLKQYAIKLGLAFQMTNILRDIGADAQNGRIYLPLEDLQRFGVSEDEIIARRVTPAFIRLMAFETRKTRGLYRDASVLPTSAERPSLVAAEIMRAVYENVLYRVEKQPEAVMIRKLRVPTLVKAGLAFREWWRVR